MSWLISKAKEGNTITLQRQDVEVVMCDDCSHLMVNIDEDELRPGDLVILKRKGVRISNPHTKEEICVDCEYRIPESPSMAMAPAGIGLGTALSSWFDNDNDSDDSSFFGSSSDSDSDSSSFGGGFGGFGGGSFSGGGASRSF